MSALGLLLAIIGGAFVYQAKAVQSSNASDVSSAYTYTVTQNATTAIHYMDNSFFGTSPQPANQAYVASLTNTIDATFHYSFAGADPANLETTYSVAAVVQANYALKNNTDNSTNVWEQTHTLVPQTVLHSQGASIAFDKTVTIPFAAYQQAVEAFRTALSLPTNSVTVATLTVHTTGSIDGTPFSDTRVSTVSIPLEQQIYQPAIKFDKQDTKQVVAKSQQGHQSVAYLLELYGGSVVGLFGIGLILYGFRKRIFRSAYRRQLDKIYRYHDGIIVRTSRPVDLTGHELVLMRSFDDMLNLEEELKTPIIADEISSTLTHFIIASNGVTYLYKLGDTSDQTNRLVAERATARALTAIEHKKAARDVLPPTAPTAPSQKPAAKDDWSDIINELDHHPKNPAQARAPHTKKIQ